MLSMKCRNSFREISSCRRSDFFDQWSKLNKITSSHNIAYRESVCLSSRAGIDRNCVTTGLIQEILRNFWAWKRRAKWRFRSAWLKYALCMVVSEFDWMKLPHSVFPQCSCYSPMAKSIATIWSYVYRRAIHDAMQLHKLTRRKRVEKAVRNWWLASSNSIYDRVLRYSFCLYLEGSEIVDHLLNDFIMNLAQMRHIITRWYQVIFNYVISHLFEIHGNHIDCCEIIVYGVWGPEQRNGILMSFWDVFFI